MERVLRVGLYCRDCQPCARRVEAAARAVGGRPEPVATDRLTRRARPLALAGAVIGARAEVAPALRSQVEEV